MSDSPATVTINRIESLTPDVRRYTCSKPEGYDYQPGQATDVSLDRDDWRDETRPFTFTSLPGEHHLEFTIKSYPDHDGVTEQIGQLAVGDHLRIDDPWGAITDQGPGTFLAGGAGVTPFISILRARLAEHGTLEGSHLIFSNTTEADIIMREEFEAMPGLRTTFLVTDQPDSPLAAARLDKAGLESLIDTTEQPIADQRFYVCGPPPMLESLTEALEELGADPDGVTLED